MARMEQIDLDFSASAKKRRTRPNLAASVTARLASGPATLAEVAASLGYSVELVHGTMHSLHAQKRVRRVEGVRPERWELGRPLWADTLRGAPPTRRES